MSQPSREVTKRYIKKRRADKKRNNRFLAGRRIWSSQWRTKNRNRYRANSNAHSLRLKIEVLTYYGKGGKLLCSWYGCTICDPDCLTLDHVKDNGREHRKNGYLGGVNGYRQLRTASYPKGFQTLCSNHQLKKEMIRRRKNRNAK